MAQNKNAHLTSRLPAGSVTVTIVKFFYICPLPPTAGEARKYIFIADIPAGPAGLDSVSD